MMLYIARTALTVLSVLITADFVKTGPVSSDTQAVIYLSQFGYLNPSVRNPSSGGLIDASAWTRAVSEFQSFAGINATGELDEQTMELMSLPRCGVKDKVGFGSDSRSKRYALQGSRWRVKNLTYKISKYPRNLKRDKVDAEIARAFAVWSKHTDLTFTPKSGAVHIEIRFEKGEHGDGDPFDGPGGTLAHAYFPVYGGDAHFDDAEQWSIDSFRGTNLFQVAAHEFGHSLGLSHSDVKSALMAPFYRGYDPTFVLDSDDITGIQALYGKKTNKGPTTRPQPATTSRPTTSSKDSELCTDPKIDALFNSAAGDTYVFKGEYYWKLTEDGVAAGYPKLISDNWHGLPGHIDAAFTYKNGKTYFFKGTQYWRYADTRMDGAYPKEISDGFTGIPDNVDAALVWSGNGKIYFYKGSKFWRFDPTQRPPVKSTYPKPISNWEGLPNNLEAALQYTNGYTYFFKGGLYYRFNDRTFSVDAADPAFPRNAGHWWFGCKSSGSLGNLENEVEEAEQSQPGGMHSDSVSDIIMDAGDSQYPRPDKPEGSSSTRTSALLTLIITTSLAITLITRLQHRINT